jgi:integrase
MSNRLTGPGFGGKISVNVQPKKVSAGDHLLDDRTLLENELKSLMNQSAESFDSDRAAEIASTLLNDFENDSQNLSPNTWKSIVGNWRIFETWCRTNNHTPLPASVDTFMAFINDKASKYKINTLQVYRWSVYTIHVASGFPSPTETLKVKKRIEQVRKNKAEKGELISQAPAFREVHLDFITEHWKSTPTKQNLRDLALLTISYETLMRESELARIEFSHIEYQDDGRAVIEIPYSKANKSGEPDVVIISKFAVRRLEAYLAAIDIDVNKIEDKFDDDGNLLPNFLFKKLLRYGNYDKKFTVPLSGYTIDKIFKRSYSDIAKLNPSLLRNSKPFSGHSARVGAAQDLLAAGYSPLEVQKSGRWSSVDMVYRYGRSILAEETAMAKKRVNKE